MGHLYPSVYPIGSNKRDNLRIDLFLAGCEKNSD
jgi:hypothetical protein